MTMTRPDVSIAGSGDRADWDAFVCSSDRAEIYHLFAWKEFFGDVFGHDCYYLIARDGVGTTVGVLPLVHLKSHVFGSFCVSVPCFNYCGVLANDPDVFTALVDRARAIREEVKATHIELRHREREESVLPTRRDKVSFRLPLPADEDELWRGFTSKLRAQIRRPGKAGAECEIGGVELVDDFYAVFSRNMRDLGTPVYPRSFFYELVTRFSEESSVFVVRIDGKSVATSLTLGFHGDLEVPFASSLRGYNRLSPNMLLYWSMLKYGVSEGYCTFDFGRCSVDSGPYRFKKQWGAQAESLAWHYILDQPGDLPQLNPENPKFRLAVNLWRHLPLSVANRLGPQVVKHLP